MEENTKNTKNRRVYFLFGLSKERDYFVENISMLIMGGVSILEAIDTILEGVRSRRMKKILGFFKEDIENGSTISQAFANTKLFPEHTISLIRLGEDSGKLNENLKIAVEEQEKTRSLKSKIYSAVMYPLFVFILTICLALGIVWFILPRLALTFSQLHVELPFITRVLIKLGNFMANYGQYFVPGLLVFFILMIFFFFSYPKTKFIGQYIVFHLPGVGKLIRELETARFGYLFGMLLEAGIPIQEALKSLLNSTDIAPYRKFYTHLKDSIEEGMSLYKSMTSYKKVNKLIPVPVQQIIYAGEKSGSLPEILLKIGRKFEEKTENATKNLSMMLEPILLVLVAIGVFLVAIAIILPVYGVVGGLN
jgi:type IV pilus assembly protein PilC